MVENQTDRDIEEEKSAIEKTNLDFWTLKFSDEYKELEKHFLVTFYNDSLNKVRFAILAAVIFYVLFGILDAAIIPDFKFKFWTIRYLIVIPLLLSVLALSFTRIFKRKIQFISAIVAFMSGISVIAIIWLAPPDLSNYYFSGLILILVMNYGFLKLRFIWASAVGVLLTILYIYAAFEFIKMPYLLSVFNSFFLIAINVVGVFISREFEVYARKEYFSNQLLKIERNKLKTLNARLEAKIKDKASQLTQLQKEMRDDEKNEGIE
jgi:hypothetical protein